LRSVRCAFTAATLPLSRPTTRSGLRLGPSPDESSPDLDERYVDRDRSLGGVDVDVGEPAYLAAAEPAQQHEPPQQREPVIRGEVQEVSDLSRIPHERRVPRLRLKLDGIYRVERYLVSPLPLVVEEHAQHRVDPVLGGDAGVLFPPSDIAGQHGLALGLPRRVDLLVEHVDPLEDHRAVLAGQPV
jgi:hypothetical protein